MNALAYVPLLILVIRSVPFIGHNAGVYNQATNTITCIPSACLHEVGHRLDDQAGFLMAASRDAEFRAAVGDIDITYEEMYAELFQIANGQEENMPEPLRKFYDWDNINWMVFELDLDRVGVTYEDAVELFERFS